MVSLSVFLTLIWGQEVEGSYWLHVFSDKGVVSMWKGEAYGATGDVDGVVPVWPESMSGMSEEEEEDLFFCCHTVQSRHKGRGNIRSESRYQIFLEAMVDWVSKVLVYLNCEEEDGMVGGKGIYNQVGILTYLELSLLQLDDQRNIL